MVVTVPMITMAMSVEAIMSVMASTMPTATVTAGENLSRDGQGGDGQCQSPLRRDGMSSSLGS